MSVPSQPEDLTASWLTDVLRERGYLPYGRVHNVQVEVLDPSSSIFGSLARLHLSFGGGD